MDDGTKISRKKETSNKFPKKENLLNNIQQKLQLRDDTTGGDMPKHFSFVGELHLTSPSLNFRSFFSPILMTFVSSSYFPTFFHYSFPSNANIVLGNIYFYLIFKIENNNTLCYNSIETFFFFLLQFSSC